MNPIDTADLQQMADALMKDPAKSIWALITLCREQREVLRQLASGPHCPCVVTEKRDAISADVAHGNGEGRRAAVMADPEGQRRELRASPRQRPGRPASGGPRILPDANSKPVERPAITRQERSAWAIEPDVGRVADGIPARVDRLRGLGNAVVPQVVEWLGRRIIEAEAR